MLGRSGIGRLRPAHLYVSLALLALASCGEPAGEAKLIRATAREVLAAAQAPGTKVALVNVWATWCQPCVEEFPDLVRLRAAYADRGLELVLVSADFDDQQDGVVTFLRRQGVDFRSYLKDQKDEEFIDGLDPRWSGALPASFVVDGGGRIVDFWEGKKDYAALEAKIAPHLD